MYGSLLMVHAWLRWLVLLSLLYLIYRSVSALRAKRVFTKLDNILRHSTATIAHVQLAVGFALYFTSPVTKYFMANFRDAIQYADTAFFGMVHITLMTVAVVLITLGSSLAKRRQGDKHKFRTIVTYFLISLVIILIAIPWPFSPLANRPLLRP